MEKPTDEDVIETKRRDVNGPTKGCSDIKEPFGLYLAFVNDHWSDDEDLDYGKLPNPFRITISFPQPRRSRGRWWLSPFPPRREISQDLEDPS